MQKRISGQRGVYILTDLLNLALIIEDEDPEIT